MRTNNKAHKLPTKGSTHPALPSWINLLPMTDRNNVMSPCESYSSHCKNLKPEWDQPENEKQFLRHGIGQQLQHAMMYTASFKHGFNSARSTVDPLIDGVTPLPLSLPVHFPLVHKPHSLYCSFLTSIYFVLSPFLSASTPQMREAL